MFPSLTCASPHSFAESSACRSWKKSRVSNAAGWHANAERSCSARHVSTPIGKVRRRGRKCFLLFVHLLDHELAPKVLKAERSVGEAAFLRDLPKQKESVAQRKHRSYCRSPRQQHSHSRHSLVSLSDSETNQKENNKTLAHASLAWEISSG